MTWSLIQLTAAELDWRPPVIPVALVFNTTGVAIESQSSLAPALGGRHPAEIGDETSRRSGALQLIRRRCIQLNSQRLL